MRRLFIFLVLLIGSVWLGLTVFRHPGFVFISYQPWMIQMPFWFAFFAALLLFGVLYLLFNSIERVQFWLFRFKNWLQFRRAHKLYSKTQHGLALLIEGQWQKAEKLLIAGADQSIEPLMNYLGAARAAQQLHKVDRRDGYLKQAKQVAPDAALAIGLTCAELQIENNEFEAAQSTLDQLKAKWPKHARVLQLLEKVYTHFANWDALLVLLPLLKKSQVLTAEQTALLEKNIYCRLFESAQAKNSDEIHKMWDSVPRHVRHEPQVVFAYATQLVRCRDIPDAAELIRKTLKSSWAPELVRLYSSLPFTDMNKQLGIVGGWLKTYGPHTETYLALGKLCVRTKLWGKAKEYFEKCLADGPNPEASLAYAKLLETIGDEHEAVEKYRDGLGALAANEA